MSSRLKFFIASICSGLAALIIVLVLQRKEIEGLGLLVLLLLLVILAVFAPLALLASLSKNPKKTFDALADFFSYFFYPW